MFVSLVYTSIIATISYVKAVSWLECTNYDPPSYELATMGDYDRARCRGYPRGFANQYVSGFGIDTGYEIEGTSCRDPYNPSDYTPITPMSSYTAGETIYMVHPSKMNVADVCTTSLIHSGPVKLYISSNTSTDTFDMELSVLDGDHVDGTMDHLGYQRCHEFCGNPDRATCLTGWELPKTLSAGVHSFRWTAELNDGKLYSTCFDAMISSVDEPTTEVPTTTTNLRSQTVVISDGPPTSPPVTTPLPTTKLVAEVITSGSAKPIANIIAILIVIIIL
jgi:hypothetical protein